VPVILNVSEGGVRDLLYLPFNIGAERCSTKSGTGTLEGSETSRSLRAFMVFVLDNYDSFTYNLVQYMGELGAEMTVRRNDDLTPEEVEALHPDRILLSPGPCTPQEAGISIPLIQHFAGKLPILGVCLGHQAIGAAFGGKVVRAPKLMHGKTSEVIHDGRTLFSGIASPMTCTRYHSLIVQENGLPRELEITARTEDGIIMGLRHRKYPVEGVQFHPESVLTHDGKRLIQNFLEM
jgi:anthranilate synthase/aminodeoxychorismate synthase-like glutamine amidotransferase